MCVRRVSGRRLVTSGNSQRWSEVLAAVRLLKYFAWEGPFGQQVQKRREEELAAIRSGALISNISTLFSLLTAAGRGLSIAASRLERRRRDLGIGASRTEREQRGVRGRVSATRLARRQRQRRDRPGAGEGESSRTDRLRRRARDRENLSARV